MTPPRREDSLIQTSKRRWVAPNCCSHPNSTNNTRNTIPPTGQGQAASPSLSHA